MSIMTTHSSACTIRQPTAPATPSNLLPFLARSIQSLPGFLIGTIFEPSLNEFQTLQQHCASSVSSLLKLTCQFTSTVTLLMQGQSHQIMFFTKGPNTLTSNITTYTKILQTRHLWSMRLALKVTLLISSRNHSHKNNILP